MKKYTEEELADLAQGVFRDDKTSPFIYADEHGTFRNPEQYAALKKEGKHTAFEFTFKNPNIEEPKTQASIDAKAASTITGLENDKAELQVKLGTAEAEVKRLTDLNAELQGKLDEALKAVPPTV